SRRLIERPSSNRSGGPSGGNFILFIFVLIVALYFVRTTFFKDVHFTLPENMLTPEKIVPEDEQQTVLTPVPEPTRSRESLDEKVEALLRSSSRSSWSSTAPQVRPFQ